MLASEEADVLALQWQRRESENRREIKKVV